MMVNLQALAEQLASLGIMQKAFYDMNRDEVEALCDAVLECVESRPATMPYISARYDEPVLIIPDDAPKELQPWKQPGLNGGYAALYRVLRLLNADDDMMRRYLGKDWRENTKEFEGA